MLSTARGSETVREVGVRVAAVALVALVAALVHGWTPLVPTSIVLVGAVYAGQLAIDDTALDLASPVVAAGLLVGAELAYWSLEERSGAAGEAGEGLGRLAFVAILGVAALLVGLLLLAVVDSVHGTGVTLDLAGAAAAAAAFVAIVLIAGGRSRWSS